MHKKIIYIDIDDTICKLEKDCLDYSKATPIKKNIKKANELYDNDNVIVYWTARGTKTKINWEDLTKKQFEEWGVKYHELKFNKPFYDIFIDDKALNARDWENE